MYIYLIKVQEINMKIARLIVSFSMLFFSVLFSFYPFLFFTDFINRLFNKKKIDVSIFNDPCVCDYNIWQLYFLF